MLNIKVILIDLSKYYNFSKKHNLFRLGDLISKAESIAYSISLKLS